MSKADSSRWSEAEVSRVVAAIMRNDHALSKGGREDRYAVDGLIHEYRALPDGSDARKRIGQAVAGYLESGTTMERAIALSFYGSCMDAYGGEVLGKLAAKGDDGFECTTRVPIGGVTGSTMREALLYAAFSWNGGEGVTEAMLKVAREDALTGDGEAFLKDLSRTDPEWFSDNEQTLLSLYETAVAAVWRARVESGADPLDTLNVLISDASANGRTALKMTIKYYRGIDADQKKELLAALQAHSASSGGGSERHRVTLKEATAGKLGSVRVGCGNFWERDVTGDDGKTVSRFSAKLAPFNSDAVVVYEGMQVDVGGKTWRVDAVSEGSDGRGRVELSTAAD